MKALHWVIFSLAVWIVLVPIVIRDTLELFVPNTVFSTEEILTFLMWDAFFIGLVIGVLALVVLTVESASKKTPGLRAMHWLQVALSILIVILPFLVQMTEQIAIWSHTVFGGFIALFALMQIFLEDEGIRN